MKGKNDTGAHEHNAGIARISDDAVHAGPAQLITLDIVIDTVFSDSRGFPQQKAAHKQGGPTNLQENF